MGRKVDSDFFLISYRFRIDRSLGRYIKENLNIYALFADINQTDFQRNTFLLRFQLSVLITSLIHNILTTCYTTFIKRYFKEILRVRGRREFLKYYFFDGVNSLQQK